MKGMDVEGKVMEWKKKKGGGTVWKGGGRAKLEKK